MATLSKPVLFLLFLTAVLGSTSTTDPIKPQPDSEDDITVFYRTHVRIYNQLAQGDDKPSFTVHCKSKDDDLGTHVIGSDEHFEWNFRANIRGTTLFFCYICWAGGSGTYDIYRFGRDRTRCGKHCDWYVKRDGIQGYKQGKPDLFLKWKS